MSLKEPKKDTGSTAECQDNGHPEMNHCQMHRFDADKDLYRRMDKSVQGGCNCGRSSEGDNSPDRVKRPALCLCQPEHHSTPCSCGRTSEGDSSRRHCRSPDNKIKQRQVSSKYLGGGWDCLRCSKKVYHAEMQIVSGFAYHKICFSCYCCRKQLEPFTFHEHFGQIFCKQCYIRNVGPQGYGYGIGAGVLQTPL